jgi:hypothetical protein
MTAFSSKCVSVSALNTRMRKAVLRPNPFQLRSFFKDETLKFVQSWIFGADCFDAVDDFCLQAYHYSEESLVKRVSQVFFCENYFPNSRQRFNPLPFPPS